MGVALLSLLISAMLATFTPLPAPQFHDEFSYLLSGDTLVRGRLTNPAHPKWEFFETFQVLQRPTYASKYQPGQGLVLALGQALFDEPVAGVWVSTALACAAAWWALAGFVPRRWATIGALVVATHPLVLQWNWSFWGGAVAVIGGALAVGGTVRLFQRGSLIAGVMAGLGLFALLISRPFEGIVLVVSSILMLRAPSPSPGGSGCRSAPIAFVTILALGLAWIGYYNWRVTGNAARLPYVEYEATYAVCPPFVWVPRTQRAPEYRHEVMREYYLDWELREYERQRTLSGFVSVMGKKLWTFASNYFSSVALVVPVLAAIAVAWRDRFTRRALLGAVLFTLVVLGNLWFFPHYTAPAVVLYVLIAVLGLRCLHAVRGGRWIVRAVLALHVVSAIVWVMRMDRTPGDDWNHQRDALVEGARREGRRLLIFVRPGPQRYAHNEFVYNEADIDASAVVWARDMGPDRNRELIDYFRGLGQAREAWLMEVGVRMEPYR